MAAKDNKGMITYESGKLRRTQMLQRHPSSYEQEPEDNTSPEKSTKKSKLKTTLIRRSSLTDDFGTFSGGKNTQTSSSEAYLTDWTTPSRSVLVNNDFLQGSTKTNCSLVCSENNMEMKKPIMNITHPLFKSTLTKIAVDEQIPSCSKSKVYTLPDPNIQFPPKIVHSPESSCPDRIIPEITIQKKMLSRFRRIESEAEPIDRDKLTPEMDWSEYSSRDFLVKDFENSDQSELISPVASNISSPGKSTINSNFKITPSENEPITKRNLADSNTEKSSRFSLTKAMSKIIEDKVRQSLSSFVQEKKRSRSPSALLGLAQKKIPQWASFMKKSEEDADSKTNSPSIVKSIKKTVTEKSKSTEECYRRNKSLHARPHCSEEYDREARNEKFLRTTIENNNTVVAEGDKLKASPTSKTPEKSLKTSELRSSSKRYGFSLFKRSKERKDSKSESKGKYDWETSSDSLAQISSKDSDIGEIVNRKSPKLTSKYDVKQNSFEEKTKRFWKQKSKDKSNESTRKNMPDEQNHQENIWARNGFNRAASAETLDGIEREIDGLVRGQFLAASMRLFFVVNPPFSHFSIRSRSLNTLGGTISKRMRKLNNHLFGQMITSMQPVKVIAWNASMPDITAANFTRGIAYRPGPTKRRSVFVRYKESGMRYAHSECSLQDFFKFSRPADFVGFQSFDDRSFERRKFMNTVFIPAIGNISLRDAVETVFETANDLGIFAVNDYSARINGSLQLHTIDSVDTGTLGSKRITLHDIGVLREFEQFAAKHFSKPTISPRSRSRPICPQKDMVKTPLSHKLRWTNIFKSKDNTINIDNLAAILNNISIHDLPTLPPDKQVIYASEKTSIIIRNIANAPFERLFKPEIFSREEEIVQRTIYELISTEAEYIENIRTIIDLFMAVATHVQSQNVMKELNIPRLFLNIVEVMQSNVVLWETSFHPLLSNAGTLCQRFFYRFNIIDMLEGFLNFDDIFHSYRSYVANQSSSQVYFKQLLEESSTFLAFITWCESQKQCKRLRLADLLIKPMQRLTKYGILLNAIYKVIKVQPEKHMIKKLYTVCRRFTFNLDCHIKYLEDVNGINQLEGIIDSYDALVPRDEFVEMYLKAYNQLRLKDPIVVNGVEYHRSIILNGDVKFKEGKEKMEVRAVLLTDFLLIMTPCKGKKGLFKVIRSKFKITNMVINPQYHHSDEYKELASIIVIMVDSTSTAYGFFTLYDINSKESQSSPTLKDWMFGMLEAQAVMEMLPLMKEDPRFEFYDVDSPSIHSSERERLKKKHKLKQNSTMEDVSLLEPIEAMMPSVKFAAKKRLCILVQGADSPKDGDIPPDPGIRSVPVRPCLVRSQSFSSSIHYCHSNSYECNDWETAGCSGNTSAGRRTISLSSEDDATASILYDVLNDNRNPFVITQATNILKNYVANQAVTSFEPVAHCSKTPMPIVTRTVHPSSTPVPKHQIKVNTIIIEPPDFRRSMPDLNSQSGNFTTTFRKSQNSCNVSKLSPQHSSNKLMPHNSKNKFLSADTRGTSYPPPSASSIDSTHAEYMVEPDGSDTRQQSGVLRCCSCRS